MMIKGKKTEVSAHQVVWATTAGPELISIMEHIC